MSLTVRRISAAALAVVGVIHLILAPEYFGEQAYVGALFVAGGLTLIALAGYLYRVDDRVAWVLGALTMAGMGLGFVASRTIGLPGFHESEWELSGLLCLVLQAGFVAAAAVALTAGAARPGRDPRVAQA